MENFLVPFSYDVFQTNEATWLLDMKEAVRRVRFTRRAIGHFFNPDSKDPQKIIDNLMARNPRLRELSIPLMVRGMTGQSYETETYDIWGIHQIAIESSLPCAKEFLRRFPAFLNALYTGKIKPPAIGKIRPEITSFFLITHGEKGKYIESVLPEIGKSRQQFYRDARRAKEILGMMLRSPRSDRGRTVYPTEKTSVNEYLKENPQARGKEIREALSLIVSASQVNNWIRVQFSHRAA